MAEIKTQKTSQRPEEFLDTVTPESRKQDGYTLLEMFSRITGEKAVMWGLSMIGFGQYHYKSERSAQEGDWPLVAFSPRKQNLSLYVLTVAPESKGLLEKLGKHKTGVGCLYINKLADVDLSVLEKLIKASYEYNKKTLTN